MYNDLRVAIAGYGQEGQAAHRFFKSRGAVVTVGVGDARAAARSPRRWC